MEARRWLENVTFPPDRPLINVSQAAPVDPPPVGLRAAIAEAALTRPDAHLYGAVLGNADLRAEVAAQHGVRFGEPPDRSIRVHHRTEDARHQRLAAFDAQHLARARSHVQSVQSRLLTLDMRATVDVLPAPGSCVA